MLKIKDQKVRLSLTKFFKMEKDMKILKSAILGILLFTLINAEDGKKYGSELTLTEKTDVTAILEKPAEFDGKKVLIEGTIVGVCESRGCWIDVAAKEGYEKIRVKVDDGVIVFPLEAKGKTAVVEGEVYALTMEQEHNCASGENKGEEKSCCSETEKEKKVYQIKGLGAVIK